MKYPEVRNGEIITENQITITITEISAVKPIKTPGCRTVSQVRSGNKKKKIPK